MATNITPRHLDGLLAEANSLANGLKHHGAELDIRLIDEPRLRALAAQAADTAGDVGLAKSTRQDASKALRRADREAARFLASARSVLTAYLGNRWSTRWEPTGFPDQSTKVPRIQNQRRELCESLHRYFTDNPGHEVAAMEVTAAQAEAHHNAFSAAHLALAQETTQKGTKMKARRDAKRMLRRTVHSLKVYLKMTLAPDDSRWHAFGLNRPADGNVPDPVTSVTLVPGRPGEIVPSWPRAARATRYRVFALVVGVDAEFKHRATVRDLKTNLGGFASGQTVKVRIVAANKSGEARPSAEAEIVVG